MVENNGGNSVNYSKRNFYGQDLTGIDDVKNKNFEDSIFTGAKMNKNFDTTSDLTNVDLTGVNLTNVKISLPSVSTMGTPKYLPNDNYSIKYSSSGTRYIIGPGVDLRDVDFTDIDLSNVNLTGANLSGANLTGTNLTYANLTGANLIRATIGQSTMKKTNFTNATLTGIITKDIQINNDLHDISGLPGNGFILVNNRIIGPGVSLNKANLENADLSGVNLTNVIPGPLDAMASASTYLIMNLPVGYQTIKGSDNKFYIIGPHVNLSFTAINNLELKSFIDDTLPAPAFDSWIDTSLYEDDGLGIYNTAGNGGFLAPQFPKFKEPLFYSNDNMPTSVTNLNLSGANLAGQSLNMNLSTVNNLNLSSVNLKYITMRAQNPNESSTANYMNLSNANLSNSDLTGATLQYVNTDLANFNGAILDYMTSTNILNVKTIQNLPSGYTSTDNNNITGGNTNPTNKYIHNIYLNGGDANAHDLNYAIRYVTGDGIFGGPGGYKNWSTRNFNLGFGIEWITRNDGVKYLRAQDAPSNNSNDGGRPEGNLPDIITRLTGDIYEIEEILKTFANQNNLFLEAEKNEIIKNVGDKFLYDFDPAMLTQANKDSGELMERLRRNVHVKMWMVWDRLNENKMQNVFTEIFDSGGSRLKFNEGYNNGYKSPYGDGLLNRDKIMLTPEGISSPQTVYELYFSGQFGDENGWIKAPFSSIKKFGGMKDYFNAFDGHLATTVTSDGTEPGYIIWTPIDDITVTKFEVYFGVPLDDSKNNYKIRVDVTAGSSQSIVINTGNGVDAGTKTTGQWHSYLNLINNTIGPSKPVKFSMYDKNDNPCGLSDVNAVRINNKFVKIPNSGGAGLFPISKAEQDDYNIQNSPLASPGLHENTVSDNNEAKNLIYERFVILGATNGVGEYNINAQPTQEQFDAYIKKYWYDPIITQKRNTQNLVLNDTIISYEQIYRLREGGSGVDFGTTGTITIPGVVTIVGKTVENIEYIFNNVLIDNPTNVIAVFTDGPAVTNEQITNIRWKAGKRAGIPTIISNHLIDTTKTKTYYLKRYPVQFGAGFEGQETHTPFIVTGDINSPGSKITILLKGVGTLPYRQEGAEGWDAETDTWSPTPVELYYDVNAKGSGMMPYHGEYIPGDKTYISAEIPNELKGIYITQNGLIYYTFSNGVIPGNIPHTVYSDNQNTYPTYNEDLIQGLTDRHVVDVASHKNYVLRPGIDMSGANLQQGADLSNAYLSAAKFTNATLIGTNFTDSSLNFADFSGADLTNATLTRVNLTKTNFTNANLAGVISSGITNFNEVTLPTGYSISGGEIIVSNVLGVLTKYKNELTKKRNARKGLLKMMLRKITPTQKLDMNVSELDYTPEEKEKLFNNKTKIEIFKGNSKGSLGEVTSATGEIVLANIASNKGFLCELEKDEEVKIGLPNNIKCLFRKVSDICYNFSVYDPNTKDIIVKHSTETTTFSTYDEDYDEDDVCSPTSIQLVQYDSVTIDGTKFTIGSIASEGVGDTTQQSSSVVGDPYVCSLKTGEVWKMPNFEGYSRMLQGTIDNQQLTINVKTTFNTDEEIKETVDYVMMWSQNMNVDYATLLRTHRVAAKRESFMRELWVQLGQKEMRINMEQLIASNNAFSVSQTDNQAFMVDYDCHDSNNLRIDLTDDLHIIISKFDNPQVKTGFSLKGNTSQIKNTSGALCNKLYKEDMILEEITSIEPIQQLEDRAPKGNSNEIYYNTEGNKVSKSIPYF